MKKRLQYLFSHEGPDDGDYDEMLWEFLNILGDKLFSLLDLNVQLLI